MAVCSNGSVLLHALSVDGWCSDEDEARGCEGPVGHLLELGHLPSCGHDRPWRRVPQRAVGGIAGSSSCRKIRGSSLHATCYGHGRAQPSDYGWHSPSAGVAFYSDASRQLGTVSVLRAVSSAAHALCVFRGDALLACACVVGSFAYAAVSGALVSGSQGAAS